MCFNDYYIFKLAAVVTLGLACWLDGHLFEYFLNIKGLHYIVVSSVPSGPVQMPAASFQWESRFIPVPSLVITH